MKLTVIGMDIAKLQDANVLVRSLYACPLFTQAIDKNGRQVHRCYGESIEQPFMGTVSCSRGCGRCG